MTNPPTSLRPATRHWELWAAVGASAFALNFAWEMIQMPLYSSMRGLSVGRVLAACALATAGDAGIALTAYGAVARATATQNWPERLTISRIAAYLGIGLAITVLLESVNVYAFHRFAYASSMPRVFGIGVAPLAQWIAVPLIVCVVARAVGRRPRRSLRRPEVPPPYA
ncbi:MAG: hypothetical protein NVS4B3_22920 [Gemmatimonadaceae bacterium]